MAVTINLPVFFWSVSGVGGSRKKNRVTFFPLREFLAAKLSRSRTLGKIRFYAISTRVLAEYLGDAEIRNVVY